jgi:hypothetical protein
MNFLQVPTPDAHTRPSDTKRHHKRCITRTLKARAFLDLLAFFGPSSPDYARFVSGTNFGAVAIFLLRKSLASALP